MKTVPTILLLGCVALLAASGCGGDSPYEPPNTYPHYDDPNPGGDPGGDPEDNPGDEPGREYIQDDTGKRWDVTYGRNYGLEPDGYQFGLGPDAIRPINNPQMLSPGDAGYPADDEDFLMIGVHLNGITRAYQISIMGWHEVVNETFGEAHVAVAY